MSVPVVVDQVSKDGKRIKMRCMNWLFLFDYGHLYPSYQGVEGSYPPNEIMNLVRRRGWAILRSYERRFNKQEKRAVARKQQLELFGGEQ